MNPEIRTSVIRLIGELKDFPEFDGSVPLIESGLLDSFDLMRLVAAISERYGVDLDGDELVPENFENVDALVDLIVQKANR